MRKLQLALSFCILLLAPAGAAFAQRAEPTARPAGAVSYLFVSPNTREGLTQAEALRRLGSGEEAGLIAEARGLTRCLGVDAVIAKALGSWADGAEHMALIKTTSDEATARYIDARLGMRARQKSVLYFRADAGGGSKMYVLRVKSGGRDLPSVVRILDRSGIRYRTIIPGRRRVLVYVVDLHNELGASVTAAARRLGGRYGVLVGTGGFIGDGEDRERSQEVYQGVVSGYEATRPVTARVCGSARQSPEARIKRVAPAGHR